MFIKDNISQDVLELFPICISVTIYMIVYVFFFKKIVWHFVFTFYKYFFCTIIYLFTGKQTLRALFCPVQSADWWNDSVNHTPFLWKLPTFRVKHVIIAGLYCLTPTVPNVLNNKQLLFMKKKSLIFLK